MRCILAEDIQISEAAMAGPCVYVLDVGWQEEQRNAERENKWKSLAYQEVGAVIWEMLKDKRREESETAPTCFFIWRVFQGKIFS